MKVLLWFFLALSLTLLGACGKKSALVLPEEVPQHHES